MAPETEGSASKWTAGLSDEDLRQTMLSALRLLVVLSLVVAAGFWLKVGWRSGLLVVVGAAISGLSLWDWLRLMTIVNQQMDAGGTPRPMGLVMTGFFLRMGLTLVVLYGSVKYLHGSVFGLAAGLGLGILSLTIEALRLLKRWTV